MQLMQARQICSIYYWLLTIRNKFLKTFRASVLPRVCEPVCLFARVSVRPCVCAPVCLFARTSVRTPVYATSVCALVQIVCLPSRVPVRPCVCGPVRPWLHTPGVCEPMHTSVRPYVHFVRSWVCLELLCTRAFLFPSRIFVFFSLIFLICTSEIGVANANPL